MAQEDARGAVGLAAGVVVLGWHPIHRPVGGYGPLRIAAAVGILAVILAVGGYLLGRLLARAALRGRAALPERAAEAPAVRELTDRGWLPA